MTVALIGAGGLDVTWLGALVADTLIANLLGAVAGDVSKIAACRLH
jgi:hypothetical protein